LARTAERQRVARDGAGGDDGVLLAREGPAGAGGAEAGQRARPAAERQEREQRGGHVHRGHEPRREVQLHHDDGVHGPDERRRHQAPRRQLLAPRLRLLQLQRRGLGLRICRLRLRAAAGLALVDLVRGVDLHIGRAARARTTVDWSD